MLSLIYMEENMKKALVIVLMVFMVASGIYASNVDVSLAAGATTNYFNMGFSAGEGEKQKDFKANVGLQADVDVFFDSHNGFYVNLGFDMEENNTITIGGGYAFKTPVDKMDCVLTVGPKFMIKGKTTTFGADLDANFKYNIYKGCFLRFGAGIDLAFVDFGGGKDQGYFEFLFLVPQLAIGWDF